MDGDGTLRFLRAEQRVHVGDARRVLAQFPDQHFNTCVTSPPYWALRDYGVDGQIGLEATPEAFCEQLADVFDGVFRVLRDDGVLWLNLGDTYANDEKWGGTSGGKNQASGSERVRKTTGMRAKSLIGVPWMVAFALRRRGWILRTDVVWHKPNPMPESVKDRPTRAHEFLFMFVKQPRYWFDAAAMREPVTGTAHKRGKGVNPKADGKNEVVTDVDGGRRRRGFNERWRVKQNASFSAAVTGLVDDRNRRDVWTVASEPYKGAHFAVMPTALVRPCILSSCPVGGRVLDPFCGSGTVGVVSAEHDREFEGIDLNPAYAEMARERIRTRRR